MQDEEYDGLKKKRRDERVAIRKKEQRIFEEESVWSNRPCGCVRIGADNARSDENPAFESPGHGSVFEDEDGTGAGMSLFPESQSPMLNRC